MDHLPVTLANLRDNKHGLRAICDKCNYTTGLILNDVIQRYGSGLPVPRLSKHLVCSECGSREVNVQVTTSQES